MAFPSLFPDGAGEIYQARLSKVDIGEYFKHLLSPSLSWWSICSTQEISLVCIEYPTTGQNTESVKHIC